MAVFALSQRLSANWKWLLPLTIFWFLLFLRGYPAPFIDDGWYAGAAISLAQHNTFSNLICDHLALIGSDRLFLAYLPWHDYVLAGWLKLFGVNAWAVCSFYTLLAWGTCVLIFRLLPQTQHPLLVASYVAVAVYVLLGGAGMRPDALGLFFFVGGFDLYRTFHPAAFFFKSLLLGIAMITMANVALLAVIMPIAALAYQKLILQRDNRSLLMNLIAVAIAYALAFLLFLWCIDFRLHDFRACLQTNHDISAHGVQDRFFQQIFSLYGVAKWMLIQPALLAVLAFYLGANKNRQLSNRLIFVLATLAAYLALAWVSFSSASGSHWWAFGCLMAALYIILTCQWGRGACVGLFLLIATFVVGHGHYVLEDTLCRHDIDLRNNREIISQLNAMHPPKIYADEYAWRQIYDYRLPENGHDFETAGTFDHSTALENLPKGSVAVISVRHAAALPTIPRARVLKILGFSTGALFENPYDLVLIDKR